MTFIVPPLPLPASNPFLPPSLFWKEFTVRHCFSCVAVAVYRPSASASAGEFLLGVVGSRKNQRWHLFHVIGALKDLEDGRGGRAMEGWLYVIRPNRLGLQKPRKRYFVLEDNALNCYKNAPTSNREVGRIPLFHCVCFLFRKNVVFGLLILAREMSIDLFIYLFLSFGICLLGLMNPILYNFI